MTRARLRICCWLLLLAAPAGAQVRRAAVGYQLTGGSNGYAAHEGRFDIDGRAYDWLGFYSAGSYITDRVYKDVDSLAGGLELNVGDEDRLRLGVQGSIGHFKALSGDLSSYGGEVGYLTQIGGLNSLGLFYRLTNGTMPPVASIAAAQTTVGPAVAPGQTDTTLTDSLKRRSTFQVHEWTVLASLNFEEDFLLDLSSTLTLVSNVGPALNETAAFSLPIVAPLYFSVSGTLEQSANLGSLQFGSLGLYFVFGGAR